MNTSARPLAQIVTFVLAGVVGCSQRNLIGEIDGSAGSGPTGGAGVRGNGQQASAGHDVPSPTWPIVNGVCTKPLAQSACKPTFDEQSHRDTMFCMGDECCGWAGACGAHKVWQSPNGLSPHLCVYDETGTTLISSRECSEGGLEECPNRAFCVEGGTPIAELAPCDVQKLPRVCTFDGAYRVMHSCPANLDDVRGRCEPTFAAQQARPVACAAGGLARVEIAECGTQHVWATTLGSDPFQCIYDGDGKLATVHSCEPSRMCAAAGCGTHAGAFSSAVVTCTLTERIVEGAACGSISM